MHVQDNWFFEAHEDGVRIAKTGGPCVHELIVSKSVWESIKREVEAKPVPKGRGAKMKNPPPKPVVASTTVVSA